MAEIAHTMPSSVAFLDGSRFGVTRPGLQVTQYETGPFKSRDWFGHNVAEYNLKIGALDSSARADWDIFISQMAANGNIAWIVEPESRTHFDVICGPIADGSRSTFWVPNYGGTFSGQVFVDGVLVDSSTYSTTYYYFTNLITDSGATCSDYQEWDTPQGILNLADVSRCGLDGGDCIRIVPNGTALPSLRWASDINVTEGQEYTSMFAVRPTGSTTRQWYANIHWFNGGYYSRSDGTATNCPPGEWTILTCTATAPDATPNVTTARPGIIRNNTTALDHVYFDCAALNLGDYDRWHLPSLSPNAITFLSGSEPAAGARVTANFTGQRVARVRLDPRGLESRITSSGYAYPININATEIPEF